MKVLDLRLVKCSIGLLVMLNNDWVMKKKIKILLRITESSAHLF